MKKTIYLSLLAGCLMTLGACEGSEYDLENQIPDKFHKILYLNISGKQDLTLYNTEEDNEYSFSVVKAGSDPSLEAEVAVDVLTQEEVDSEYSELEGINYKVISPGAYSFNETRLSFSANERYKLVNLSLKPREVLAALENDPSAVWVLPLHIISETDSINANKDQLFLQLKDVVMPSLGFKDANVNVKTYTYGFVSTISEKVSFKLDTDNKWDIDCGFMVNGEYVNQYNKANNTVFRLLPESAYSFTNSMTLLNGTAETHLPVEIEGGQLEPGDYMLPIQINSVSRFEVSSTNGLYPMAIRIMGTQFDRTGWTAEANTEELIGESAPNGPVRAILDDNLESFWHSKWKDGSYPLPHELIIDVKREHTFTQFALVQRENAHYVKSGEFYVSSDKESWEKVGNFSLKSTNGSQIFSVMPKKGRYFKILINESNHNSDSALAEVYAYGIE